MAYVSKVWVDRQTEFPNRRTIVHQDTTEEQVIVGRNEGTVYVEGDAFSAQNMNNLESRINAGITAVARTDEYPSLETQSKTITGAINELSADKNLAEEYDFNQTYAVGDYVIEGTQLYKCIEPVVSAEAFDPDKWEAVLITDEMGSSAGAVIDDTTIDTDKTWSSSKIDGELGDKQGVLTAGTGISISPQNVISATGGGGSADIIKTVSGAVATITDGADNLPVKDLTAQIVPQQSGTGDPSPSNVRPISGYTGANVTRVGKNLFNESDYSNIYSDREIYDAYNYYVKKIQLKPNTTYTVSNNAGVAQSTPIVLINATLPVGGSGYLDLRNASGSKTYTTDDTGLLYIGSVNSNDETAYARIQACKVQIEVGSTATTYEPYNATTYSVTWQTESGTVYGGYIDLTTGVLTVTHGLAQVNGASIQGTINDSYYALATPKPSGLTSNYLPPVGASDKYKYVSTYAGRVSGTCYIITNQVAFVDDRFTSLAEAQRILDEEKPWICYELATPQTYQLTPTEVKTILGTMNIVADTGNISVEYPTKTVTDIASVLIDDSSTASNVTWSAQKISQSGGGGATYTAGENISISQQNVISARRQPQNMLWCGNDFTVFSTTGTIALTPWLLNGMSYGTHNGLEIKGISDQPDYSLGYKSENSLGANLFPDSFYMYLKLYIDGDIYTVKIDIPSKSSGLTNESFSVGNVDFTIERVQFSYGNYKFIIENLVYDDSNNTHECELYGVSLESKEYNDVPYDLKDIQILGYINSRQKAFYTQYGTLTAGNTTITLSSTNIYTSYTYEIFTDTWGVNPTNVVVANGSITLTFDAQQADVGVKVRWT